MWSGSGPGEISNSWNWPGWIFPPVQTIRDTAVVILPSSVVTGVDRVRLVVVTVHPGNGLMETCATGWSAGSATSNFTVEASDSSSGTRKVSAL